MKIGRLRCQDVEYVEDGAQRTEGPFKLITSRVHTFDFIILQSVFI